MIKENAHRQVREEAISGFREFLRWQMSILRNPPVGRIVEDLCDKINSSSDADLQRCVSVLQALCAVLTICGEKAS
jgi:histone H3/H4